MKTLTITEAKKNLGKWLNAAGRGEEIGIINGAQIFTLQPVEVRAVKPLQIRELNFEYASKEYGATRQEFDAFRRRIETEARTARRGDLAIPTENLTFEKLEKAIADHRSPPKAARRTRTKRADGRPARSV